MIVAVKDRGINAFHRPFFTRGNGDAIRSFQDEINNPESQLSKHPDDYDLYVLGAFDDNTGEIIAEVQPVQIAIGKQLVRT